MLKRLYFTQTRGDWQARWCKRRLDDRLQRASFWCDVTATKQDEFDRPHAWRSPNLDELKTTHLLARPQLMKEEWCGLLVLYEYWATRRPINVARVSGKAITANKPSSKPVRVKSQLDGVMDK